MTLDATIMVFLDVLLLRFLAQNEVLDEAAILTFQSPQ
jgi:hypothetical protein